MPSTNKNNYDDMKQRDILIEVATTQKHMMKKLDDSVKRLDKEDDKLHGRVNKTREDLRHEIDKKVGGVHRRVDKMRVWSGVSGVIGGFIGAISAYFTGGKQ